MKTMNIKDYPARLTTGYYRVRETWEDASSQLGAFRLLANAMAKADANPGYFVFSNEGEAIYPEPESGIEETEEQSLAIKILTAMRHPRRLKKRRSIRKQPLKTQKELQSPVNPCRLMRKQARRQTEQIRNFRRLWSMTMMVMTRSSLTRS